MSVSLRRAACGPRSVARSIGVSLLVALLLAATSLAAHWHSEGVASDSCSVCVAAHHSPIEPDAGCDVAPRIFVAVQLDAPTSDPPALDFSRRPMGRSPPLASLVSVIA